MHLSDTRRWLLLVLLVMLQPAYAREPLVFGVFAYLGVDQTRTKYAPLVAYLNQTLRDETIELRVLTQEQINQGLARGELDIVTTNPTHFLVIRKAYPLSGVIATLVSNESGQALHQLAGVIVASAQRTDLAQLRDVRAQRIATPSLQHMGGYRAQAFELHRAGLRLPQDVASITETGTHQQTIRAVLAGQADIGFVRNGILERMLQTGELQPGQIKVLNPQQAPGFPHLVSTTLYPEWPVFASQHVPERTLRHVAAALFALEPEHPLARAAGIHGFTVAADYLVVEDLARSLRLPPFDHNPEITWRDVWHRWGAQILLGLLALLLILGLASALGLAARRERRAKLRHQMLLETLGEGVYGTDMQGRCTFVNGAASSMLGFSEAQLLGAQQHSLFQHRHEDGSIYPPEQCPIHLTLQDGTTRRTQEWFTRRDGSGFAVEQVVTALRMDGVIVGSVVAFQDIQARHQTELLQQQAREQTERARQSADAANRAKSAFLATMSHEIRTPMNGILGMAQVLLAPGLSETQRLEYARVILGSGETLLTLLNDILDFSKVEAGKIDLEPVVFDPQALLHDVQLLFAPAATRKGLRLLTQWNGPSGQRYRADSHRLRQMLSNLVGNAIKFTEQGQITLAAQVLDGVDAAMPLEFSVTDTGPGLSEAQQSQLFVPFSQVDASVTRRFGGTGLGLSIVRALARLMGGQAGVYSQPGQGARFWFTVLATALPALQDSRQCTRSTAQPTPDHATLGCGLVLVVDDNPVNRLVAQAMLEQLGLPVALAEDGQQCLQQLTQGTCCPALVLMDLHMPVLGGIEATQQIRAWEATQQRPRLPIVALTADAFEEDRQRCLQVGMDDFLPKPIALPALRAALQRWLPSGAEPPTKQ